MDLKPVLIASFVFLTVLFLWYCFPEKKQGHAQVPTKLTFDTSYIV